MATLSFIAPLELNNNNKEIICAPELNSNDADKMYCPFTIESKHFVSISVTTLVVLISEKPSLPINTTVVAIGSDKVNISWDSPSNNNQCIGNYTVTVNNGSTLRNISTNNLATSIIIDELGKGITYSFYVREVDLIGKERTISETVSLTMDGMRIEKNYYELLIMLSINKFQMLLRT